MSGLKTGSTFIFSPDIHVRVGFTVSAFIAAYCTLPLAEMGQIASITPARWA